MSDAAPVSKGALWTGRILSWIPSALLIFSAAMKFSKSEELAKGMTHLGWPVNYAPGLGILELSCVIVYLIPKTSIVGAILLTGYMGGAMATHVRIGEPPVLHVLIGVVFWLALYLREPRLRALIPLRS